MFERRCRSIDFSIVSVYKTVTSLCRFCLCSVPTRSIQPPSRRAPLSTRIEKSGQSLLLTCQTVKCLLSNITVLGEARITSFWQLSLAISCFDATGETQSPTCIAILCCNRVSILDHAVSLVLRVLDLARRLVRRIRIVDIGQIDYEGGIGLLQIFHEYIDNITHGHVVICLVLPGTQKRLLACSILLPRTQ